MMNKYVAIVEVELKPQSIEGTGFELIDDWKANQFALLLCLEYDQNY